MSGVAASFVKAMVAVHMSLATPGSFAAQHLNTKEVTCLAKNIYFEARDQDTTGQMLVAKVTRNRVESRKFPSTFCGVVYQKAQFSWTLERKKLRINDTKAWAKAVKIATYMIVDFYVCDEVKATYYFNPSMVDPYWRKSMVFEGRYGDHDFYRPIMKSQVRYVSMNVPMPLARPHRNQ